MDAPENHLGDWVFGAEDDQIIRVVVGSFVSGCSKDEPVLFIDDEAREFCGFEHGPGFCHHGFEEN